MKFCYIATIILIISFAAINTLTISKHDYTSFELKKFNPSKARPKAKIVHTIHKKFRKGAHGKRGKHVKRVVRKQVVAPKIKLNSIGQQVALTGAAQIILDKFPFKPSRCDQIVKFKAKYIPDMGEYRNRADAWFTLTAHYANMFQNNDANKLLGSILLTDAKVLPGHLRGTGHCVVVRAGFGDKDITICLPNVQMEKNILSVISFFQGCRGGLYNKKLDKLAWTKMVAGCALGGTYVDPRILLQRLRQQRGLRKGGKHRLYKDSSYFHPGSDDIPGIPGVGNRNAPKPLPASVMV